VVWYRKAVDQGDAVAPRNLSYMYENGRGVPKSNIQAMIWYSKAANQGNQGAMEVLVRLAGIK
jgi:TPR repeat protein